MSRTRPLTLSKLLLGFFVFVCVVAYPIAVFAEDGTSEGQISREARAPQTLFADAGPAIPGAPAISEADLQRIGRAAQQPPQPTVAPTGTDFSASVSSLAQIILAVVSALLAWPLSRFFGTQRNATEILNDVGMGKYASYAAELAVKWALQATGTSVTDLHNVDIRNSFLKYAAEFLNRQFPECVTWALSSGTLAQFIEAHLPHEAAMPPKPA